MKETTTIWRCDSCKATVTGGGDTRPPQWQAFNLAVYDGRQHALKRQGFDVCPKCVDGVTEFFKRLNVSVEEPE